MNGRRGFTSDLLILILEDYDCWHCYTGRHGNNRTAATKLGLWERAACAKCVSSSHRFLSMYEAYFYFAISGPCMGNIYFLLFKILHLLFSNFGLPLVFLWQVTTYSVPRTSWTAYEITNEQYTKQVHFTNLPLMTKLRDSSKLYKLVF